MIETTMPNTLIDITDSITKVDDACGAIRKIRKYSDEATYAVADKMTKNQVHQLVYGVIDSRRANAIDAAVCFITDLVIIDPQS